MRRTMRFYTPATTLTSFFTAEALRIRAGQLSPFTHLPLEVAFFQQMAMIQRNALKEAQRREVAAQETPAISFVRTNTAPGFVVIGNGQFAQRECKLSKMAEDGVKLVRRKTGGGAVFIDDGNVMFTIIRNAKTHPNLTRDVFFQILINAINETFGVTAYRSGGKQNDVYVGDKKVAGVAFGKDGEVDLCHTCILVSAQMEKLKDYLEVDLEKLQSKGIIDSNRQMVTNLNVFDSTKTCQDLADNLEKQFSAVCGASAFHRAEEDAILSIPEVRTISAGMQNPQYLLREPGEYNHEMKKRFLWGSVRLFTNVTERKISGVSVYTDALDANSLVETLPTVLKGERPVLSAQEDEVVRWVQSERKKLGLPELQLDNSWEDVPSGMRPPF